MKRKVVLLLLCLAPLACGIYDYNPPPGWNRPQPLPVRHASQDDTWLDDKWGFQGKVTVGPSDVAERATVESQTRAVYSEDARKQRITGVVVLEIRINATGTVTQATVLKPLDPGLDQNAVATVQQWRFKPARLNGEAKPSVTAITVNFQVQ
jgi:TonB family protein